jgi:cytochrome P450
MHLMGGNPQDPEVEEILKDASPLVDVLLTQDPPLHRIYRQIITREFTAAKVNQMDGYIAGICDDLIDRFIDKGRCDFFQDFAAQLPVYVVCDKLGAPREDLELFKQWTTDSVSNIGRMKGREAALQSARSSMAMQRYFLDLIARRKEEPRDDFISEMINARFDEERLLTTEEALSMILAVLVAGIESATNALSGGLVHFIRDARGPDYYAENPELIPDAVDEILRLETTTKHMWRMVTTDTELGGVSIPANSVLLLSYDAANRDPAVFADPDTCDFSRENADQHLAFGAGIHRCVGALLAHKELSNAYKCLFSRLTDLRVANEEPLRYLPSILHRGFEELHITFSPREKG